MHTMYIINESYSITLYISQQLPTNLIAEHRIWKQLNDENKKKDFGSEEKQIKTVRRISVKMK